MKDIDLDNLIQAERSRSLPSCPVNVDDNVLRRIRNSGNETESFSILEGLMGLSRFGTMLGILSLTVILSSLASVVVASSSTSSPSNSNYAAQALHFDIFTEIRSIHLDH